MRDDIDRDRVRQDDGTEPQAHRTPKLELRRVPAGGSIGGIILDEQPVKVFVHYIGRRTVPCMKTLCPGCEANQEPVWKGYVVPEGSCSTQDSLTKKGARWLDS